MELTDCFRSKTDADYLSYLNRDMLTVFEEDKRLTYIRDVETLARKRLRIYGLSIAHKLSEMSLIHQPLDIIIQSTIVNIYFYGKETVVMPMVLSPSQILKRQVPETTCLPPVYSGSTFTKSADYIKATIDLIGCDDVGVSINLHLLSHYSYFFNLMYPLNYSTKEPYGSLELSPYEEGVRGNASSTYTKDEIEPFKFPNTHSHILKLVRDYIHHYGLSRIPRIKRPVRTRLISDVWGVDSWSANYITSAQPYVEALSQFAHYLGIDSLRDLCLASLASRDKIMWLDLV